MKFIRTNYYLLLFAILSIGIGSCEDSNENLYKDSKSINELNKDIIQVNVTNISTGFQSVFNTIILDSTSRASVSQEI